MTTRVTDLFLDGDHASRPAVAAVAVGALYACSDHDLIYKNDGAAWVNWATLISSPGAPGEDGAPGAPGADGADNVLLLELGGTVPGGTATGTIIFEKDA